jgi:uncharacterized phage protein (TIGR01671 family)
MKQREVKFRAWNVTDKKWNKVSEVFGMNDYFKDLGRGIFHFNRGDVILSQYTGLLDKNGKEIYEGDIVKYQIDDSDCFGERTNEEIYMDIVEYNKDLAFTNLPHEESFGGPDCIVKHINIEVIGNIFENKRLLKKTNREKNRNFKFLG